MSPCGKAEIWQTGRLNANQPVVARYDPTWIPAVDKAPWTNFCLVLLGGSAKGDASWPPDCANLTFHLELRCTQCSSIPSFTRC